MALPTLFFLLNFFKVLFSVVVIPSEQKHLTNLSLAFTNTCYSWWYYVLCNNMKEVNYSINIEKPTYAYWLKLWEKEKRFEMFDDLLNIKLVNFF